MEKNYRLVFVEKGKVVLEECEIPAVGDNELLLKTEVTQISTGTELTRLEGNVEKGSAWEKDIVYPIYPGYSNRISLF